MRARRPATTCAAILAAALLACPAAGAAPPPPRSVEMLLVVDATTDPPGARLRTTLSLSRTDPALRALRSDAASQGQRRVALGEAIEALRLFRERPSIRGFRTPPPELRISGGRATAIAYEHVELHPHDGDEGWRLGPWLLERDGALLAATLELLPRAGARPAAIVAEVRAGGVQLESAAPVPEHDDGEVVRWRLEPGERVEGNRVEVAHRLSGETRARLTSVWQYVAVVAGLLAVLGPLLLLALVAWRRREPPPPDAARALARGALAAGALAIAAALSQTLAFDIDAIERADPWLRDAVERSLPAVASLAALAVLAGAARAATGAGAGQRERAALVLLPVLVALLLAGTPRSGRWSAIDLPIGVRAPVVTLAVALALGLGALIAVRCVTGALPAEWGRVARRHRRALLAAAGALAGAMLVQWVLAVHELAHDEVDAGLRESADLRSALSSAADVATFAPLSLTYALLPLAVAAALVALARRFEPVGPDEETRSVDGRARAALAIGFAGLLAGPATLYVGVRIPLGLLAVAIGVAALAHPRWRWRRELARIVALNPGAVPLHHHRRDLFERATALDRLRRREHALDEAVASRGVELEASRGEHAALGRERRELAEGPSLGGAGPARLRLPPGLHPGEVALAGRRGAGWWDGGLATARAAAPLAFAFTALFVALSWDTRFEFLLERDQHYGVLLATTQVAVELAGWLAGAFALGALHERLPGMSGPAKGVALAGAFAAGQLVAAGPLTASGDDGWAFRALEVLLFLVLAGVAADLRALASCGFGWRQLAVLYGLRQARVAATYAATAGAALFAFGQQLASGAGADALGELAKSLPSLLPPG